MSELTSEQIDNILSRIVVRKSFSDPKGHCYVSLDGRMKPIDFTPEKQLEDNCKDWIMYWDKKKEEK